MSSACSRPDSGSGIGQNYLPILEEAILKETQPLRTLIESAGGKPSITRRNFAQKAMITSGTCPNHLNLLEQKQVGETTNMMDIVTHMQLADKVISLT